jgi:hypothetical protein
MDRFTIKESVLVTREWEIKARSEKEALENYQSGTLEFSMDLSVLKCEIINIEEEE